MEDRTETSPSLGLRRGEMERKELRGQWLKGQHRKTCPGRTEEARGRGRDRLLRWGELSSLEEGTALIFCYAVVSWSANSQASAFPLHVIPGSPSLAPALPDFSPASRQVCSWKFQASSLGDMLTSKFPKDRKKESGSGHSLKVTRCQAGQSEAVGNHCFPR